MSALLEHRPAGLPLASACGALNISRSSAITARRHQRLCGPPRPRRTSRDTAAQPRALSALERARVLETLNSERFCDQPPAAVYYTLLSEGRYLCSISTMHRLLRVVGGQGERRAQRPPQSHTVPRLKATRANEVWTWDVTKLPMTSRGVYLSLYVVLDLYSRYVVAWMISRKENSALAQVLMETAIERHGLIGHALTIHQDRGSPMIAQSYLELMHELGATCSHSRPRVSNDNPFSESQFKTLKYQPDYPGRFTSVAEANRWCEQYFTWYNQSHCHTGLSGFTPADVYSGEYLELARTRQLALTDMYERHPERFVQKPPKVVALATAVEINPVPPDNADGTPCLDQVNVPTLPAFRKLQKNTLT